MIKDHNYWQMNHGQEDSKTPVTCLRRTLMRMTEHRKKSRTKKRSNPNRTSNEVSVEEAETESKMGLAPARSPLAALRKKNTERKQQEEANPAIEAFVSQVCEMRVAGLRKLFVEQLAMLCPPTSKCRAFEENPKKNRYMDIVCLEATRVVLQKENPTDSDYIHANWVNFEMHDRKFIATQGPMDHTCDDFWRMILQNKCPTIVNLTKIIEDGKPKCAQYWPEKAGDYAKFGTVQIINKKVEADDDKFTIYTLDCVMDNCSDGHIVKMIHVTSWPDKGVPLSGMMILRMIRCITTVDPLAVGPVVVHCSAGISRTGTIILIDVILQRLFKNQMNVDLAEMFKSLRLQRASCIQKEGHFVFMVMTILDYIKARLPNKFNENIDKFKTEFKVAAMNQN